MRVGKNVPRVVGDVPAALASEHSLYAMVGEDPRSIDDFNSILAHSECIGPTREVQGTGFVQNPGYQIQGTRFVRPWSVRGRPWTSLVGPTLRVS